jgi:hypothetical protein
MCRTSPPAHRAAGTQPHDDEARALDGVERRAIAIAADDEPVEPAHPALETGQLGMSGTGRGGLAALEAE